MKNARIFLAVLLILAVAAFVGCANYDRYDDRTTTPYTNNTTGDGIVNNLDRATDRVTDNVENNINNPYTTTNNAINNTR